MWWTENIASQARTLQASYAERRAAALLELRSKLLSELGQRVLAKAAEGKSRYIVYFDQLYASDLLPDPSLRADFSEQEQADLEKAVADWCVEQGLTAERSVKNPYKFFLRWQ